MRFGGNGWGRNKRSAISLWLDALFSGSVVVTGVGHAQSPADDPSRLHSLHRPHEAHDVSRVARLRGGGVEPGHGGRQERDSEAEAEELHVLVLGKERGRVCGDERAQILGGCGRKLRHGIKNRSPCVGGRTRFRRPPSRRRQKKGARPHQRDESPDTPNVAVLTAPGEGRASCSETRRRPFGGFVYVQGPCAGGPGGRRAIKNQKANSGG